MFQGATQFNLDGKGRLTIPTRYRDMLLAHCAGQLVLTADADGCLLLYPQPEWQPIREKLMQLSAFNLAQVPSNNTPPPSGLPRTPK